MKTYTVYLEARYWESEEMKAYAATEEAVYSGDVTVLGVFSSEEKAKDLVAQLEKTDTLANPKHPSIYYAVKEMELDDDGLIKLRLQALECLNKKNYERTFKKSKFAKKDSSQVEEPLSMDGANSPQKEEENVEE